MDGSLISDEDRRYRCLSRGLLCLASGGGGGGLLGYMVYLVYLVYISGVDCGRQRGLQGSA